MSVSREIDEYIALLQKWNQKINLISRNTVEEIKTRHIEDSRQLKKYIALDDRIIDVGSGAGLPGIVISIDGIADVVLIEADERKSAFLRQAAKISKNRVEVLDERVESIYGLDCDVLVARAFASIKDILSLTKNIDVRKKYLLLKGKTYRAELSEAGKEWLFEYNVHDSISSDSGVILEIFDVRKRENEKDNLSCKSKGRGR